MCVQLVSISVNIVLCILYLVFFLMIYVSVVPDIDHEYFDYLKPKSVLEMRCIIWKLKIFYHRKIQYVKKSESFLRNSFLLNVNRIKENA